MPVQFDPPSGTRDFLAAELESREAAFAIIKEVFASYAFEPLQTPAFERLDVLMGKYGDEGDKLIFKILRRGEHEASGEADLALRYDMTVPLARVAAAYGSQLPSPYKRYTIGPVWRADRPGKGRYREFTQCDLDTLSSRSPMADAEVLCAVCDVLTRLDLPNFKVLLNSRPALSSLLSAFGVPAEIGTSVLITLDKLDKLAPAGVITELTGRGLPEAAAQALVGALTSADATEQVRVALKATEDGVSGLEEINTVLELVRNQVPADRIAFTPRLVRGLAYYTGPIWEVVTPGMAGSLAGGGRYDHLIESLGGPGVPATGGSLGTERILAMRAAATQDQRGRLDVAVTIMDPELAPASFGFAAAARSAGARASVYLGSSGKLGRQLKWASDAGARFCLIYGRAEQAADSVIIRDMSTGDQTTVPSGELADRLSRLLSL
ncbi:MAG TPA: histidine--tRNA ligase [Streptosporangiaceae bacterium]